MEDAIDYAEQMDALGIHKQVVNRLTEPFAHIKVVLTSVYWENWDGLRRHGAADPTICALAEVIHEAREASVPNPIEPGEWHLPYITNDELATHGVTICKKISTARCARVSYNNHDGTKTTTDADLKLHDMLVMAVPPHMSPSEHQATPDITAPGGYRSPHLHGNLVGWVQYRRTLEGGIADR